MITPFAKNLIDDTIIENSNNIENEIDYEKEMELNTFSIKDAQLLIDQHLSTNVKEKIQNYKIQCISKIKEAIEKRQDHIIFGFIELDEKTNSIFSERMNIYDCFTKIFSIDLGFLITRQEDQKSFKIEWSSIDRLKCMNESDIFKEAQKFEQENNNDFSVINAYELEIKTSRKYVKRFIGKCVTECTALIKNALSMGRQYVEYKIILDNYSMNKLKTELEKTLTFDGVKDELIRRGFEISDSSRSTGKIMIECLPSTKIVMTNIFENRGQSQSSDLNLNPNLNSTNNGIQLQPSYSSLLFNIIKNNIKKDPDGEDAKRIKQEKQENNVNGGEIISSVEQLESVLINLVNLSDLRSRLKIQQICDVANNIDNENIRMNIQDTEKNIQDIINSILSSFLK